MMGAVNLPLLAEELRSVPQAAPHFLRAKSRDFFWFSPVLKAELEGKIADLVFVPETRAQLEQVASACARYRVPLTVRGGGTGNYGQAVPLKGGVVVDMTRFDRIVKVAPGFARFEAGCRLLNIDKDLRGSGWEMRFFPSTRRLATIGGFVAGGAGGIGSCTWGQLADPGAVIAAQVMTVETRPRMIELRNRDVLKVLHAYGINGILTEIEMPMAPQQPWAECIIAFPSLRAACSFGYALTAAEGIAKKLVSIHDAAIRPYFRRLGGYLPEGSAFAILMVNEPQLPTVEEMAGDHNGTVVFRRLADDAEAVAHEANSELPPLYEFTWNHTTLRAIKIDQAITYLQLRFPAGREVDLIDQLSTRFGDELIMHMEFQRRFGRVFVSSLPLVRFRSVERLNALISEIEAMDVQCSNPHTFKLEGAGWKRTDAPQAEFKRLADPYGVMNPGKLAAYAESADQ